MRIAILTHTLPAALPIYDELKGESDCEVFILLCPTSHHSGLPDFLRHIARLLLKQQRLKSLARIIAGKVFILRKPLDHPRTLARLTKLKLDIGLHKSGTIYREPTINCFRLGILNPHIGILPGYRGRSVMEWAILEGGPVGVSVFFIDSGIDTGERILLSEEVSVSHCRSIGEAKEYLFNLDAKFFRRALALLRSESVEHKRNEGGRRYYVMSRLFQGVAEQLIRANN